MDQPRDWNEYALDTDPEFIDEMNRQIPYSEDFVPEQDDFTPDTFASYLQMELALLQGPDRQAQFGKVTKRLKDKDGRPIGVANNNPLLDTRMYKVEFPEGHTEAFSANIIAENMFAQVDDEGHRHVLMKEIIDPRKNGHAVSPEDGFITSHNGVKRKRERTVGWELLAQWRDGSTSWLLLKDLKNSFPMETAEYAVANKISSEPAFSWWCKKTLQKRNRIISKAKTRYWIRTHKYGIKIPKNWAQAVLFDDENRDTLWQDAIHKEMKVVRPAFKIHKGEERSLIGYTKITGHLIFDIKLGENFKRKARYVADGHKTGPPSTPTYASVVSRDSVQLFFLLAALNDLKVAACDIEGAYLTADCREKIYIVAGPEFGSEKGLLIIIRKALYGLKSSGAAFRSKLAATLRSLYTMSQLKLQRHINAKTPRYDLLVATRRIIQRSTQLTWHYRHVRSHQHDLRDYDEFDSWEQLNVDVDDSAMYDVPNPTIMMADAPWTISIRDNILVRKIRDQIYSHVHQPIIKAYWIKKEGFTEETYNMVDWQATGQAMKTLPIHQKHNVVKPTSGWCSVGKMAKRWHLRPTDHCPRCGQPETARHVWQCRQPEAIQQWHRSMRSLRRDLGRIQTSPAITDAIIERLTQWKTNDVLPTFQSNLSNLMDAISQQDEIGWDNFLEGTISKDWQPVQAMYFLFTHSRKSTLRWASALIRKTWKVAWDQWEHRNGILHNKENNLTFEEIETLELKIRQEFSDGRCQLPKADAYLFRGTVEKILRRKIHNSRTGSNKSKRHELGNITEPKVHGHQREFYSYIGSEDNHGHWQTTTHKTRKTKNKHS